jgi:zinc resistance-associated protein
MKKHLLVAATAAVLAFPSLLPAVAQTAEPAEAAQGLTPEDRATLVEARIAAVKTGLHLTAGQDKLFAAFETKLLDLVKVRSARRAEARAKANALRDKDETIQLMQLGADDLQFRAEELRKFADAAAPLFASLDAAQKHKFALLLRTFAKPGATN